MKDTSMQMYAIDKSVQVTPHLAGQIKMKEKITQFTEKIVQLTTRKKTLKRTMLLTPIIQ